MKNERRKETRTPVISNSPFAVIYKLSDQEKFSGLVANVSEHGACIFTYSDFNIADNLKLINKALGTDSRQAEVKWCNSINGGIYRVGCNLA